ncbi:phage portal protein [Micromonospora sp. CPCC 206060]|uniref:phage portal protein n=1 Tax=Micromonospora sp. CPCC 206060 TaxID=3122406 RepID=UPI002FEF6AEC
MRNPMAWLGKLLTRSTRYTATDTVTGESQTFTVVDNIAPDWSTSGYRGGMSIPGGWRAAVLISDLLGSVPWHAYRQYGGKPLELLEPTPPLLEQPNPPDSRMTTFSSWALDLLWEGNAFGVIAARNAQGWPTAVVPVPASMVGVRRITGPGMSSQIPIGELEYAVGTMRLAAYDVIHIKGPCEPGALRGMGVLEVHLSTLNLAQEQNRQARALSRHGVPTGVLKSDNVELDEAEARKLKARWMESQRERTIAVLNSTTSFVPLSWNPEELQLVEARRFGLTDFELIFGLPVGWLGGMNSARQYSNIEQDAVNLLKFTLGGHLARFEQTLSLVFPRGTTVKANLDAILRADTLTRYQAHAIGLDKGFLTKDEVRALENRPPLPEPEKPSPPPVVDEPSTDPNPEGEEPPL